MRFYHFNAHYDNPEKSFENTPFARTARLHDVNHHVAHQTAKFNQTIAPAGAICTEDVDYGSFEGIIIDAEDISLSKVLKNYLKSLGIKAEPSLEISEISFSDATGSMNKAEHESLIADSDVLLEQFGLRSLNGSFSCRDLDFEENLIEPWTEESIKAEADKSFYCEGLASEFERIFASQEKKFRGHPVHYILEFDNLINRKNIHRLLLRALYSKGRIKNRRYTYTDVRADDSASDMYMDSLFRLNAGGALIIRFTDKGCEEDDLASTSRRIVEQLTRFIQKYRNEVLTILCFPRECELTKSMFMQYLEGMSFIELSESFLSPENSRTFLAQLAKGKNVRPNKKLYAELEEGKQYLPEELNVFFDNWYNNKLKDDFFPEYKNTASIAKKMAAEKPKGNAYDELMSMTGLTEAKAVIQQALDYYKAHKIFADKGLSGERPAMNMVFTGNPGTAKTTVARLFAGIMRDNGLLTYGDLIEVGRSDLVGQFVGWTAPAVRRLFRRAQGSVLFIDEAYSLVDDRDGSFGDEAINTIVQEMENHRSDVVVIFAGYPDKMEKFLQKNPGLRSRIGFHVPFADYSPDELCDISRFIAKGKGFTLTEDALSKLHGIYSTAVLQSDFGNGRYARNMVEKATMAQCSRLLAQDVDSVTEQMVHTLCADDFRVPVTSPVKTVKREFGFCA